MKSRDVTFDVMKGIGIILVVLGHVIELDYFPIKKALFTFHMPLFFILAGYFNSLQPLFHAEYAKKSFVRLIRPYLITCLLICLLLGGVSLARSDWSYLLKSVIKCIWCSGMKHHSMFLSDVPEVGALWFLPALFWCRISFNAVLKYFGSNRCHLYIAIGVVSLTAGCLDYFVINLPFAILPGLSALPFYIVGFECKKERLGSHLLNAMSSRYRWLIILLGMICWIYGFVYSYISMCSCSYACYPIDFIAGIFGTWCVYMLAKRVSKHSKYLSWVGMNSLLILCIHTFEQWNLGFATRIASAPLSIFIIRMVIYIVCAYFITKINIIINSILNLNRNAKN